MARDENAPYRMGDLARILDNHFKDPSANGPVTFAVDRILVNRSGMTAETVDVYYAVTFAGRELNGISRLDYSEFREQAGGFGPLFGYISKELFSEINEMRGSDGTSRIRAISDPQRD